MGVISLITLPGYEIAPDGRLISNIFILLLDSGTYDIKCETLEKLLHALDVRHVTGWYAPAMRHAADALTLRGANNELRQQLKQTRYIYIY